MTYSLNQLQKCALNLYAELYILYVAIHSQHQYVRRQIGKECNRILTTIPRHQLADQDQCASC